MNTPPYTFIYLCFAVRYTLDWTTEGISANNVSVSVVPNENEDCYNYIKYNVSVDKQSTVLTSAVTQFVFGSLEPYTLYDVETEQYVSDFYSITLPDVTRSTKMAWTLQAGTLRSSY